MRLVRVISSTRYLILIPVVGLALASAVLFLFGGIGLVIFVIRHAALIAAGNDLEGVPIFDLLQYVHQFLIGTVLYITALGFYQLFIQDVPVPDWMKAESAEDLETSLVGVIIVVLAIEFLGAVFSGAHDDLLPYGAGIALPIAALALFLGVRHRFRTRHRGREAAGPHGFEELSGEGPTESKAAPDQAVPAQD